MFAKTFKKSFTKAEIGDIRFSSQITSLHAYNLGNSAGIKLRPKPIRLDIVNAIFMQRMLMGEIPNHNSKSKQTKWNWEFHPKDWTAPI